MRAHLAQELTAPLKVFKARWHDTQVNDLALVGAGLDTGNVGDSVVERASLRRF